MAITAREFFKISGKHARGPPGAFLFLNLLQINSAGKTTLEKMSKFGAPSLKKFLTAPQTYTFLKGLFTIFFACRRPPFL